MGEVQLTKTEFRALSSGSRTAILKSLLERNYTLSELSEKLGMAAPTIKEHANILLETGLIELRDEGRKWKYYSLTRKGSDLLEAKQRQSNILIILSGTAVVLAGLLFTLSSTFIGTAPQITSQNAPSLDITKQYAPTSPATENGLGEGEMEVPRSESAIAQKSGKIGGAGKAWEVAAAVTDANASGDINNGEDPSGRNAANETGTGGGGSAPTGREIDTTDYSNLKCTPLFDATGNAEAQEHANDCYGTTEAQDCLRVDNYDAAAKAFGEGDGQPDCSWKDKPR